MENPTPEELAEFSLMDNVDPENVAPIEEVEHGNF